MKNDLFVSFIAWFVVAMLLIWAYVYIMWSKIDKMYAILDVDRVNLEIETECN